MAGYSMIFIVDVTRKEQRLLYSKSLMVIASVDIQRNNGIVFMVRGASLTRRLYFLILVRGEYFLLENSKSLV
jgi:hypothetical protein